MYIYIYYDEQIYFDVMTCTYVRVCIELLLVGYAICV